jgi:hypothetical protein
MEDHTGKKWTPGIPLKEQPSQELVKLGEVVAAATMTVWGDEVDRYVLSLFSFDSPMEMTNHHYVNPAHSDAQVALAEKTYQHSDPQPIHSNCFI